ncbi:hypothetical protein CA85_11250 [Allorhodopirellula solitaria]|uniref:Uncharacterized protein n=1 Tax=Allorhodopirellula solitaria TaxID=2527987 RepID=A0A5C5YGG3_9BACT|nr:hypothetical protein CA85_11250 [Allorhodopirellula solitaria]
MNLTPLASPVQQASIIRPTPGTLLGVKTRNTVPKHISPVTAAVRRTTQAAALAGNHA